MAPPGIQFWQKTILFVTYVIVASSAVYRDSICKNDGEISCLNEQCIPSVRECDGQIDCDDGSDEALLRCRYHTERPLWPIIFHCSVGWDRDLYRGVCPDVCHHPRTQDFCTYALLAEYGEPNTCKLPPLPDQGYYLVEDYGGADTFSLYYSCNANYDLDGPNYPRCEGGVWLNKHPNCIRKCPVVGNEASQHLRHASAASTCKKGRNKV